MTILGIETSGMAGSVALLKEGGEVVSRELARSGRRHAQSLVQEIDRLFDNEQLDRGACDAVAVSIGPGSFTGLRVGVVCAKTWAYATGCDLIAVDTFQAIAQRADEQLDELYVVGDAQRGDLFVGRYRKTPAGDFSRAGEIAIVPAEEWIARRNADDWVSGPGIAKREDAFAARCRLVEGERRLPAAAQIVQIGRRLHTAKVTADIRELEPFYLRRSAAEEKWDAEHGIQEKPAVKT